MCCALKIDAPLSYIGVLGPVPSALLPIQTPFSMSGNSAEENPNAWVPVTHLADSDGALRF